MARVREARGGAARRLRCDAWSARCESFLSSHAFILLFLLAYANALCLMFVWGARDQFVHTTHDSMRWFIAIARGFGYSLNLNAALVILLASRLTFTLIRETPLNLVIPFDKLFPAFHIYVGYTIAVASVGHAVFHIIWIVRWDGWAPGLWGINMCVATGALTSVALIVMIATSIPRVRKANFHRFYVVHNVGAFSFFLLLLFHGMYNGQPYTWKWCIGPIALYLCDRVMRRLKVASSNLELSGSNSVLKGADVLQLKVPKQFGYRAGQYAEVKVPSISKTEWHPFTIASAPFEDSMVFYIKALGDWTGELRSAFQSRLDGKVTKPLQVRIRGPYGAPAQHVVGYQRVVLISGGVGSTPFSSICKELHHHIVTTPASSETKEEDDSSDTQDGLSNREVEEQIDKEIARVFSLNLGSIDDEAKHTDEASSIPLAKLLLATDKLSTRHKPQVLHGCEDIRSLRSRRNTIVSMRGNADAPSSVTFRDGNGTITSKSNAPQEVLSPLKRGILGFPNREDKRSGQQESRPLQPPNMKRIGISFAIRDEDAGDEFTQELPTPVNLFESNFARLAQDLYNKEMVCTLQDDIAPERSMPYRTLGFLHSIRVNLFLLLSLLFRLVILGYASIFNAINLSLSKRSMMVYEAKWLIVIDVVLGLLLAAVVGLTICLELFLTRLRFFKSKRRCIDFFVLLPLAILSTCVGIGALGRMESRNGAPLVIHFYMVCPLLFALVIFRLHRIIGSRVLLADTAGYARGAAIYDQIRAIDFIWTTPYSKDDDWLREELCPLSQGSALRLHRFVTRERTGDVELGEHFGLNTSFGRPNWDALFQDIARKTPSHAKVGVFFCGPHGMAIAVRNAIMKAQTISNLRGGYLDNSANFCERDLLEKLRARGSFVRFVFREENFG